MHATFIFRLLLCVSPLFVVSQRGDRNALVWYGRVCGERVGKGGFRVVVFCYQSSVTCRISAVLRNCSGLHVYKGGKHGSCLAKIGVFFGDIAFRLSRNTSYC